MAILALGKARSRREPDLGCGGGTDLGDVMFCQKNLHERCRSGRRNVVMKLILLALSLGMRRSDSTLSSVNGVSLPTD